jgi:hypothetical protein
MRDRRFRQLWFELGDFPMGAGSWFTKVLAVNVAEAFPGPRGADRDNREGLQADWARVALRARVLVACAQSSRNLSSA